MGTSHPLCLISLSPENGTLSRYSHSRICVDRHVPPGKKGQGFKSVFKLASVVHRHSSNYSFEFENHQAEDKSKDDDGIGIITTIWTAIEPALQPIGTRLVLS